MARENQGLKGALIVFVLLTIIFAVITAILFSGQAELKQKAKKNETSANEAKQTAVKVLRQIGDLQEKMGFKREDDIKDVEKGFASDMEYFKTYAKESRNYREVLQNYKDLLDEKDKDLAEREKTLQEQSAELTKTQERASSASASYLANMKKFEQRLTDAIAEYRKKREDLTAKQEEASNDLKMAQDGYEKALENKDKDLKSVNNKLVSIKKDYRTATNKIRDLVTETPDVFLGSIKWINQNTRMAWINLGSADALRPQTTFSVYAPGANEASEITKKASIRVTKILGEHLAEAKVLEDQDVDPILPGDKIFTPIWNKGERRHFALTGFADIDGDGIDDRQRIYSLIELNGGVVDAPVGKDGKRQGEMTLNTRYLVLGKTPEAAVSQDLFQDFNKMNRKAEDLNVETITLQRFLEMLGWKHEGQVVDSSSSVPVKVEAVPPTSTGDISDLFRPRRPPRSFGGSVH